jgi:hypothetical protein
MAIAARFSIVLPFSSPPSSSPFFGPAVDGVGGGMLGPIEGFGFCKCGGSAGPMEVEEGEARASPSPAAPLSAVAVVVFFCKCGGSAGPMAAVAAAAGAAPPSPPPPPSSCFFCRCGGREGPMGPAAVVAGRALVAAAAAVAAAVAAVAADEDEEGEGEEEEPYIRLCLARASARFASRRAS